MIRAVTLRFRTTTDLDFNKRYNISAASHHRSQTDGTTCPECPGMCWTRQHPPDGITTKAQPDHRLATSAGEKEKRFLRSDNEQPNLRNWEVPRADQQMLVIDMRLITGKDQNSSEDSDVTLQMTGSVTQRAPAWRGATSTNPDGTGFPGQLCPRQCWEQGSSSCCSPACQGLTPTRSLRCSRHGNTGVTTIFSAAFWLQFFFFFQHFYTSSPDLCYLFSSEVTGTNSSSMEQTGILLKYRLLLYFLLPVLPTQNTKQDHE